MLVLDSSRSARTDTLLLVFLVTRALRLTLATLGRPPAASGSVFSVLLSSKLARLTNERSCWIRVDQTELSMLNYLAMLRVVRLPRPLPRPPRLLAMGVPSMRLVSVLLSSASRVLEVSLGEGGVTLTSTRFWSSLLVSLNSAIT